MHVQLLHGRVQGQHMTSAILDNIEALPYIVIEDMKAGMWHRKLLRTRFC
jgi:hypothetical protein